MLERAKARREKLDTQLSNAGHDVKQRRSPLKDANALLVQAAGDFSWFSFPLFILLKPYIFHRIKKLKISG